jgi:hypothetical protein
MRARGAGSIVGRFPAPRAGAHHIGQNGEFIVVEDGRINKKLAKRYRQAWSIYYRAMIRRVAARDESMAKTARAVQWQVDHFTEIPVLVVACLRLGPRDGRLSFVPMPHAAESGYFGSIYPGVQNLVVIHSFLSPRRTFTCGTLAAKPLRRRGLSMLALITFRYRRP